MKVFDRISVLHLMAGALQAMLAYGLYQSAELHVWPATHAAAYIPLFMVMVFLPLSFYCASEAIAVRRWLLSIGVALAAALVGLHQGLTTGSLRRHAETAAGWSPSQVGDYLGPALIFFVAAFLLVPALALISRDRWRVDYARWVDALLRNALILAQAALVLALFWGVLASAAGLFKLVALTFLADLIEQAWFSIPLSTLVFAHAVSVVVSINRVADFIYLRARQLCGWLDPLAALLGIGFVGSWGVQGIERLLSTGRAASLLLWFVVLSLLLLNLASRGGAEPVAGGRAMRTLTALGKLVLLPMVAVAGYSLSLRISQYGLTPERVWAMVVTLIVGLLVGGYVLDALVALRGRYPGSLMPATNVVAAVVTVLAILLLLGGPLDPRRLSVNSQMARLDVSGGDDQALVNFLAWQGGSYGVAALTSLAREASESDSGAARRSAMALQMLGRMRENRSRLHEQVASLPVFPRTSTVPSALLERLGDEPLLAGCSAQVADNNACLIWALQLEVTGQSAFVVLGREFTEQPPFGRIWFEDEQGGWQIGGTLGPAQTLDGCEASDYRPAGLFDAVVQNRVEFAAKNIRDLVFDRFRIPTTIWSADGCR